MPYINPDYTEKTNKTCRKCNYPNTILVEEMTDVHIAAQMVADAYDNKYDVALLIAGDNDLGVCPV